QSPGCCWNPACVKNRC
uniref:Alpha-conotoxin PIB n=1 Tax=Conus purpurascens TaxID=41690 RepID=CA1B_CONPU|nr:RecName: Full=Alpha-conotoxin PIB [Conus purpurascens]